MSNKVFVHACGGAGINIADKALNQVGELGSGFAELKFSYVDTSRANIGKINPRGEFWLVESESHLKNTIEGSGGERRSNSSDIVSSANKYLDARGIKNKVTGEFHVVVFSASGGKKVA